MNTYHKHISNRHRKDNGFTPSIAHNNQIHYYGDMLEQ